MLLSKDVVPVERDFVALLQHIPGTKGQKQVYFDTRGIRVPRTNYEVMWEALTSRLHHSGAASAVFELLRTRIPTRVSVLLRIALGGNVVTLNVSDPVIVYDLFFQNGKLRKLGELFLQDLKERGLALTKNKPTKHPVAESGKPYELALSFAGEDRGMVVVVARELQSRGVRVFYDEFEQVSLLGKDLTAHLGDVYRKQASYCAMFISQHYVRKAWPQLERQHALARALDEKREYILPVRIDDSEVPGLPPTIGYVDSRQRSLSAIADILFQKVRGK